MIYHVHHAYSIFLHFADKYQPYDTLLNVLNHELFHINNCFYSNKLSLNVIKANYTLLKSHQKQTPPTDGKFPYLEST